MTNPVPGSWHPAVYRQRGPYWSLDRRNGEGLHTGLDFAKTGTNVPILSATPGRVIAANAYDRAYGYKVIVRWGGYDVWYCHMPPGAARVKVGDTVAAGQRIGTIGATGNVTGAHLHMELRTAGGGFALANFRDPMVAVNHQEEDTMPEPEDLWNADLIKIEEPVRTAAEIKRNPTWTPASALTVLLREQAKQTALLARLVKALEAGGSGKA